MGDAHLRTRPPEARKDPDFAAVCLEKLAQVFELADSMGMDGVIQPGDFFDSADPSKELLADVIDLLLAYKTKLYAIHGQHDMAYHSSAAVHRSALRVMEAAKAVVLLTHTPTPVADVMLYGNNFGDDPANPALLTGGRHNILVTHAMVGDKPLWPGHDLLDFKGYINKWGGYSSYIFGDYHYKWVHPTPLGGWAMDAGCLLRLNQTDVARNHQPGVFLWDTDGGPVDHLLSVAPVESVFLPGEATKEHDNQKLMEMVEALRAGGAIGVSFKENLETHYLRNNTPMVVRELISKALVLEEKHDGGQR
jgi:DNA repair exonuclease SbcCD nuclease subunit